VKKQYQIRAQRAMDQFQEWAPGDVDPIQLNLPAGDMLKLAQQSLRELPRQVGKMFVENVLEAEVEFVYTKHLTPPPRTSIITFTYFLSLPSQPLPLTRTSPATAPLLLSCRCLFTPAQPIATRLRKNSVQFFK